MIGDTGEPLDGDGEGTGPGVTAPGRNCGYVLAEKASAFTLSLVLAELGAAAAELPGHDLQALRDGVSGRRATCRGSRDDRARSLVASLAALALLVSPLAGRASEQEEYCQAVKDTRNG